VLQTALDFVGRGLGVFVVADATGSRDAERRRLGLERMRQEGVRILHSEMAAFEWLQQAGTDLFRRVAPLLR
jgi:nicotinamidase-related amidase